MDPLSKITSVIPAARRQAIQKIINTAVKRGDINSNEDVVAEFDRLTKLVKNTNSKSSLKIRNAIAGKRISSEDWNLMQNEIFIDLITLYEEIKNIAALSSKHSEINRSELRQSKAAIIKAVSDIRGYQFLRENPQYQDVKYINFSDGRNTATRRPLANVDSKVRTLELGARRRDRLQQQNLDLRSTKVTTRILSNGVSGGFDESFKPENMLDDNPDTFWAELVMNDGVNEQKYVTSGEAGIGTSIVSNGVIAEVELQLSNTQTINNINLLPFGAYPVRIIDLAYKETPYGKTWIKIPTFVVGDPTLDWLEWSFNPINVAVLRVTLEQVNYTSSIFHIPESLVHNQSLWSQILNQRVDESIHQIEITEVTAGKIAAEPEQLAYLNALSQVDEEIRQFAFTMEQSSDIYKVVTDLIRASGRVLSKINPKSLDDAVVPLGSDREPVGDNPAIVEIRKNEFVVGLRSIEMSNILYQAVGYYESPKFVSSATIIEVSMESNETHNPFNDGISEFYRTSIEHEIEIGENVRFPIVPANSTIISIPGGEAGYQVSDEYIEISRFSKTGFTRFTPLSINALVRKNSRRINFTDYTFTLDASSTKGQLNIINGYDANAVYTVSYIATSASAIVDINDRFNSTDLIEPDTFSNTTRNNAIKTTYFPYIEYEIVNNQTRWVKDDEEDARWRFNPTIQNYKAGTISIHSGSLVVTGHSTVFTGNIDASAGITNVFRIKGDSTVRDIQSVIDETGLTLEETYEGENISSGEYQVGQSFKVDGRTYALDQIIYEPIEVLVNGIKAFNLTDYRSLEHPAFTPGERSGRQYQFIHAGQRLYFNKPIESSTIEVYYAWLTQYVQVKSTLRCNIPVRTNITPKVNDLTIQIKNSKL